MHILVIDQGTTCTTTFLLNGNDPVVKRPCKQGKRHCPKQDWTAHNPEQIWQTIRQTTIELTKEIKIQPPQSKFNKFHILICTLIVVVCIRSGFFADKVSLDEN